MLTLEMETLSHNQHENFLSCEIIILVYVELDNKLVPCKFRDDFGDLYQNEFCEISNNLNQFTYLRSASGVNIDVIKMVAIALLIRICIY